MGQENHAVSKPHRGLLYAAVWRWHFYAALLVIPFVNVLAITGAVYLFKPQIDPIGHAQGERNPSGAVIQVAIRSDIHDVAVAAHGERCEARIVGTNHDLVTVPDVDGDLTALDMHSENTARRYGNSSFRHGRERPSGSGRDGQAEHRHRDGTALHGAGH